MKTPIFTFLSLVLLMLGATQASAESLKENRRYELEGSTIMHDSRSAETERYVLAKTYENPQGRFYDKAVVFFLCEGGSECEQIGSPIFAKDVHPVSKNDEQEKPLLGGIFGLHGGMVAASGFCLYFRKGCDKMISALQAKMGSRRAASHGFLAGSIATGTTTGVAIGFYLRNFDTTDVLEVLRRSDDWTGIAQVDDVDQVVETISAYQLSLMD